MRALLGDPDGNSRLTAAVGVALLVLLAVEGVTILFLRPLLPVHFFVGLVLIPPVSLKLASTGWRFAHYYRRDAAFVEHGAPLLLLRALAPVLVLATVLVFGSGVALLVLGRGSGPLLGLHKVSFVVWGVVFAVHVLGHARRLPGLVFADWRSRLLRPAGSASRKLLVGATLVAGLALGLATIPLDDHLVDVVRGENHGHEDDR
jgi:hypothetical protein